MPKWYADMFFISNIHSTLFRHLRNMLHKPSINFSENSNIRSNVVHMQCITNNVPMNIMENLHNSLVIRNNQFFSLYFIEKWIRHRVFPQWVLTSYYAELHSLRFLLRRSVHLQVQAFNLLRSGSVCFRHPLIIRTHLR